MLNTLLANRRTNLPGRRQFLLGLAAASALAGMLVADPLFAGTLPTTGTFVAGSGHIATAGPAMTITQATHDAIINWKGFSIGVGNKVQFNNGSGATLNRVMGNNLSAIEGQLGATGSVYLINPNGVVIGPGGKVVTGGDFVASTRNITNQNFLQGGTLIFSGTSPGMVVNKGKIVSTDGSVVLVGQAVDNSGNITAANGTVGLAAGNTVLLQPVGGDQRVFVQTSTGDVTNSGQIKAATAELRAADGNVYALAGNNSDMIEATGSKVINGQIWLTSNTGSVTVNGTVKAQNADGSGGTVVVAGHTVTVNAEANISADGGTEAGGNIVIRAVGTASVNGTLTATGQTHGGDVETSGKQVELGVQLQVSTTAADGPTGTWLIDPQDYTIAASGGDITGSQLSNLLASNNITIDSTQGAVAGSGNINVNDAVSWSSVHTLTMDAYNNINFNAGGVVTSTGGGSLVAHADDTGTGTGTVVMNTGTISASGGGAVSFYYNPAVFGTPGTFSGITTSGGTTFTGYMLVNNATNLEAISTNLSGDYALGTNIDASSISNFTPIGTPTTPFTGVFDGQGHTISNVTMNYTTAYSSTVISDLGMFANNAGTIQNLTVSNINVTGNAYWFVGDLVGQNNGNINNVAITGTSTVTQTNTATNFYWGAGALAGSSGATGPYANTTHGYTPVNSATISASSVSGTVTVIGVDNVGGLVGWVGGGVVNQTSSNAAVRTVVNASSAFGIGLGGLIGWVSGGTVENSYSTGLTDSSSLTSGSNTSQGGFVGALGGEGNGGTLQYDYSTGKLTVVSGASSGGFLGSIANDTTTDTYWNTTTSGAGTSKGSSVGLTTAQMETQSNFTGFNFTTVWVMGTGTYLFPILQPAVVAPSYYPVTISGLTANNKVYDTTTTATFTGTASLAGIYPTDPTVSLAGTAAGTFASPTVATGIAVSYSSGLTLTGDDSTDYVIAGLSAPLAANITPAVINLTGTRVYDANTDANAGIFGTINGVGGQTLTLSGTGTLASENVGSEAVSALGTLALGNGTGSASNYTLTGGTDTATITPAPLTITSGSTTANNKIYDSTTAATLTTSGYTLSGVYGSDVGNVSLTGGTGTFATPDVGTGITVTATGYTLTGSAAGNYTITTALPTGLTANITAAIINLTGTRTYDATTTANAVIFGTINGVGGQTLTLTGSGTLAGKNVGSEAVSALGTLALGNGGGGGLASNYTLTGGTDTANITPAPLTVTGTSAAGRAYNGSTSINLTGATLTGTIYGSDVVALATDTTGTLASAAAGMENVTTAMTLTGTAANNYSLTQPTGITAVITQAGLTVTGITTANNKTYDSTAAATLNTTADTLVGVLPADSGNVILNGGTGTFASPDVANGISVTATGFTLTGSAAGNYTITTALPTGLTADITAASINLTGTRAYDTTTTAAAAIFGTGGTISTGIGGQTLTLTGSATLTSANASGTPQTISPTGLALNSDSGSASNYTFTGGTDQVTITPAQLTITSVLANNKTYDTTTTATLSSDGALSGLLGGQTMTLNAPTAVNFSQSNVGNALTVTASGYSLSSGTGLAGNYSLSGIGSTATTTANITPASLTITGSTTANNKVYDTTTAATLNTTSTTLSGVFGSDVGKVSGGGGTGTFASANVGTNIAVTATGFTLAGSAANNYIIMGSYPTGLKANITAASINLTGTRAYDANTTANAVIFGTAGTINTGVGGQTLTLTGSGTLAGKNVGSEAVSALGTLALGNGTGSASNYTLTGGTDTATITPAIINLTGTRVYDANTDANNTLFISGGTFNTGVNSETLTLFGSGTLASKNVGNEAVSALGTLVLGNGTGSASNYTLTGGTDVVTITPASLTITGSTTANNKVYDTNTNATLNTTSDALVGVLGSDSVSLA